MEFTDQLVEAIVTDPELAGYPASALVAQFLRAAPEIATLDRHTFAEHFARAVTHPLNLSEGSQSDLAAAPLGYQMRALWRVLGCIYAGTDIQGRRV